MTAISFFKVAIHELAHIRDYQKRDKGVKLPWSSGKTCQYDKRPEEIRANAAEGRKLLRSLVAKKLDIGPLASLHSHIRAIVNRKRRARRNTK